ncbi:MAG: sulfotransferase, partial [Actinobacteria bacterium]|nr:sulfotransferase [Actinomycetota bacterium]
MGGDGIAPVTIDDYAAPNFAPQIREAMDAAKALDDVLDYTVDGVVDQAAAELRAHGVADPNPGREDFRPRMQLLFDSFWAEPNLSHMGRISLHTMFVQMTRNRMLLEDLLARHPEIRDIEIRRPIIVAGLPRTGTTHLQQLLATDTRLRSLPYWESLEPFPMPNGAADRDGRDGRWERTHAGCEFMNAAMPYFKRMHEMDADHVHEEIQLLAIDFSSMFYEPLAPIPAWRDDYLERDQTPHYEYLKTVLQALTFLRGGKRWLLKSPQHLEQFGPISRVFPDATVVVTHRDPVEVTVSMATMAAYTGRMQMDPVDPVAVGAYWADRVQRLLNGALRDRHLLRDAQSLDVRFDDFMADTEGTLEAIYEQADLLRDPDTV